MSRPFAYLAFSTLTSALLIACLPPDEPGDEAQADTETGDGDGDDDPTTGDGDGDGDGDPTAGDGDGEPEPDADEDGVADSSDNCPDVANPNQRDFDDNGLGNACDIQVYTTLSGTLDSSFYADGDGFGDCTLPLPLEVTGGEVRIQLDDDAAVATVDIVSLEFADIPGQDCEIIILTPVISVFNFDLANSGDSFPVSIPHSPADHDAGVISGDADAPHPVLSDFTVRVSPEGGEKKDNPYSVDGELPVFAVSVTQTGAKAVLTWDAPNHVLASGRVTAEGGLAADIPFEVQGIVGSINMLP
jgi:hypothetical protein